MKWMVSFNQKQAIDAGVKNVSQAIVLDLLTSCSSWASPVEHHGKIYYWVSRQSICRELPLMKMKPDTAYRHLRSLAQLGLIDHQKDGKKDLVRLTAKGKRYHSYRPSDGQDLNQPHYVGKKSELSDDEIDESQEDSDKNHHLDGQNDQECPVSTPHHDNSSHYVGKKSESTEKHYVGKKSEFSGNTIPDLNPEKPGNNSENPRKKIRHIHTTKDPITRDPADGEYSNIGSDIRFAMHDEWEPSSDHFPVLCRRAGLVDWQTYHTQEVLTEFILWWSGQPHDMTQYNWELKYLKQLQRSKAHANQNQSNGSGSEKPSRFIDENDTSFLDDDPGLREAIGLKSNG